MLPFASDYMEGAHEKILERLVETNYEHNPGYGTDAHSGHAKELILSACGLDADEADVFFLVGGTQTNQIVTDSLLRSYEGVLAARTGHVATHEAGAIEHGGHKVLELPEYDGKIKAADIAGYMETFLGDANHEHEVFPGMVYISHPTEFGTLYTVSELEEISGVCGRYGLKLYMDGARLGYGLAAGQYTEGLPDLKDIARLTDVFYIGGTKVGALMGEAVVYTRGLYPAHFVAIVKQHGGLLAKGWLTGIQFETLFTDGLYMEISGNAIRYAMELKKALQEKGYQFYIDSPTNQQFIVMSNERLKEVSQKVAYSFWCNYDEAHTVIRLATSWATRKEDVEALIALL